MAYTTTTNGGLSSAAVASLPSTLAGAADHISERLDIAMFSITRRLRNQMVTDDDDSFLSNESDNDLKNITLSAMQAEAESTLFMQEQLAQDRARNAFARAKEMSDFTRGYDTIAANALRRQQLREIEAEEHQMAARLATANAREAQSNVVHAEMNARVLQQQQLQHEQEQRNMAAMVADPWVMEDYKEYTDVLPFDAVAHGTSANETKETVVVAVAVDQEETNDQKEKEVNTEESKVENVVGNGAAAAEKDPFKTKAAAEGMSLMDRAKALFQQKESIVDGCVNGLDAEIIFREMGANSVEGSAEVSRFILCVVFFSVLVPVSNFFVVVEMMNVRIPCLLRANILNACPFLKYFVCALPVWNLRHQPQPQPQIQLPLLHRCCHHQ